MRVDNKENQSCFILIPFRLSGSHLLLEVEANTKIIGTEMQGKVFVFLLFIWQDAYVSRLVHAGPDSWIKAL